MIVAVFCLHSHAPAIIVIHNLLQEQRNPEGVQAISRWLSVATPPDGKPNKIGSLGIRMVNGFRQVAVHCKNNGIYVARR